MCAAAIPEPPLTTIDPTERPLHVEEAALRAREARHAFLVRLGDALRPLRDPHEIQTAACRLVGETLACDRAYHVELDWAREVAVVARDHVRAASGAAPPSLAGTHPMVAFGATLDALRAGRVFVGDDAATDPRLADADRPAYLDRAIRAWIAMPLMEDGRVVAALCVTEGTPRAWRDDEVALLEEVATRTWEAVARARAEAELRASEARYRALFDTMEEGFGIAEILVDDAGRPVDYRMLDMNAQFERLTGQPRAPFLSGRTVREVAPELEEHWYAFYGNVGITGTPAHAEIHEAAWERWFRVSAYRIGEPAERRVAILFDEITARRKAELEQARLAAEVTAERERLRTVMLRTPTPLCLVEGPELRFTFVNEAYKRISAGGRDVTGLTPRTAFPELAGTGIHELFDQVYATGEPWIGHEVPVTFDRDGTGPVDTVFDLRFEPVRDAAGRIVGVFNFAFDVTEQVRARREVERLLADAERARAEAEAANLAKGEFLAVMSHELRTPLNAIGGYVELLALGVRGPVSEAQQADLARIRQSQRHLLGLINQVLNYTRIDAHALPYDLADVPASEALAAAEALVVPQARARGLALVRDCDPGDLAVRADREKLQQVLLNLLGNAIKFTDAPGEVHMCCASAGDGRVAITVRDTGVGIAPEKLASIFEPFVQVDQRLTRPHEGVGLGLAISRELARGMGGDLLAESAPGKGSTFTLLLPAA